MGEARKAGDKDNQLVRDGITILTVMGTDSIEKRRGGGRQRHRSRQVNRSKDDRLTVTTLHIKT